MSLFKPLSEAFTRPPSTSNPYGLTDAEISSLRRLRSQEEYQVWMSALDKLVKLNAEALLASESPEDAHAIKNQLLGLRRAGSFVDEVILRVDSKREDERKRTGNSESAERRARRLAFFGSPFGADRSDLFGSAR